MDKVQLARKRWNMNIMYANSSVYMRQTLKNMLTYLGYPNLTPANDGDAAWALIDEESVDMVVADTTLQKISGLHLLMKMRSDKRVRNLPFILVVEEEVDMGSIQLAQEYDVDGILIKPFDVNKLRAMVVKSFEKRVIFNKERELLWQAEEFWQDGNIESYRFAIEEIEEIKRTRQPVNDFRLALIRSNYFLKKGEYTRVREIIAPMMEKMPYKALAFEVIANSYFGEGNNEKALHFIMESVRQTPEHHLRTLNALEIAEKAENRDAVIELLRIVENYVDNGDANLIEKLLDGYRKLGDWVSIVKIYNKIARESETNKFTYNAHKIAINAFHELEEFDRAVEVYAKLAKTTRRKDPIYLDMLNDYGNYLRKIGKDKEAIIIFKKLKDADAEFAKKNAVDEKIEGLQKNVELKESGS